MPALETDPVRNFRARAWMWFRICRKCGSEFEAWPARDRLSEKARERGMPVRPRKLCVLCVINLMTAGDDDE